MTIDQLTKLVGVMAIKIESLEADNLKLKAESERMGRLIQSMREDLKQSTQKWMGICG